MRSIIDGVTYNTDTSTLLAKKEYKTIYKDQEKQCEGSAYKTREGVFFVRERMYWGYNKDESPIIRDHFKTCSAKEAEQFIRTGDVDLIHDPFLVSRPS